MDRPSLSSHVSFTSEISSTWRTPATRSTANAGTPQGTVTALQGGSTPLYLHTLYTDSIASPSSGSRPDTTVLTRAIPIKNDNMYDSFGVSAYSYTGSWSESSPPTTSIMPLPANPPAAIMHLPPPITGPVLHIK